MSGWRDNDGRTARDRRKLADEQSRADLLDTLRYRPHTLIKPVAAFLFALLIVIAVLLAMR